MKANNIYASECCRAECSPIGEVVISRKPWEKVFYRLACSQCGKPSHQRLKRAFDSAGNEIKSGDIIEVPNLPADHPEHWHIAYTEEDGWLRMGDLESNNIGIFVLRDDYFTRGPYWKHLDKVTDAHLSMFWNTTRAAAEQLAKRLS